MNMCQFAKKELYDLDMLDKETLRSMSMLTRQGSDKRFYMKRQDGGRSLKGLRHPGL